MKMQPQARARKWPSPPVKQHKTEQLHLGLTTTCVLAGRGVVASAPALGAGDREFESPRPDEELD